MSALGDRAAIALALECAAKLQRNSPTPLYELLRDADVILAWMDSTAKARAKADPIRTPNHTLPEDFYGKQDRAT